MAKSGSRWERESSRILSEWLTGQRNPPVLWRSVSSGGWEHAGVPDTGDLAPRIPEEGCTEGMEFCRRFSVECKSYKNEPNLWALFSGSNPKLLDWWTQAVEDCQNYEEICPLLLANRSHYPELVGLPASFPIGDDEEGCRMVLPRARLQVILLDEFLGYEPEVLYERWEVWQQ